MRKATRTQWIKCSIAILLYLIFLIWVKSWWGLIVVPFIFDIYITKKIPWSFWKKSKNPTVRSVMSWVDAIVFALVAVYFVNIYVFQNYQIPSSSLEKSLLVGDFLYVSKMSYGPRVPNTPLSMPLAQHTLPILNTKSYIEWPQWKYKRVPGFGKVKLNDIVVFNFPAGDTVALNFQDADFYTLAYNIGKQIYPNPIDMDSLTREQQKTVYDLYYNAGRKEILSNPQRYGKVVTRPVDRRENYVKRCVGLPGDTLQIINGQVMIDGKAIENPENLQFNYFVQTTGPYITEEMFRELGISKADQRLTPEGAGYEEGLIELGLDGRNAQGGLNPVYHLPLTKKMYDTLSGNKKLVGKIVIEPEEYSGEVYDLYYNAGRKEILSNPQRYGKVVTRPVDRRENYVKRCVGLPGDTLQIINGQVMIDGKAIENPENLQFNYFVQTTGPYITEEMFRELGISKADQRLTPEGAGYEEGLIELGLDGRNAQGGLNPVYHLPLTKKMYDTLSGNKKLVGKIVIEPEEYSGEVYPLNLNTHWNRSDYGPIWIPAKGATITLTPDNLPIYERCITAYEGNKLEQKEDGIYINGVKTNQYTFQMDYYWMMGDNRHNSADSRYWGFVPEDHVVGKPIVVWLSLDKDRNWFDGKIRWNRIFKWVD